jgi:CBS domain containing-hemolysin-like protein
MDDPSLSLLLISLAFSAFFSGMEIAFVSANRLEIELDKKLGYFAANIYSYFSRKQGFFITTMLVGNNIALVMYGMTAAGILEGGLSIVSRNPFFIFIAQTLLSTTLVLIAGEFFPKILFRVNPNQTLKVFAIPTVIICIILSPLVGIALGITYLFIWLFTGGNDMRRELAFSRIDLEHYIREVTAKGAKNQEMDHEVQIFQNALYFSEVKVRDCMVPRTEIIALDIEEPIDALREAFMETGLSKILIYKGELDNVLGYVHSFALFKSPTKIKDVLMPLSLVPEAMPAHAALSQLNNEKRSILGVIDEFGTVSGIVTVEDIVEEIVGDIEDEHDKESYVEQQLDANTYLLSARLEIDYINETFGLSLPESDEYETLGGLIIHHHGAIPDKGATIAQSDYTCIIKSATDSRIDIVELHIHPH